MSAEPAVPRRLTPWKAVKIGLGAGAACFLLVTIPLLPGPAILEIPAFSMVFLQPFFVFPFLVALVVWPVLLILWCFQKDRAASFARFLLATTTALALFASFLATSHFRSVRFAAVAESAAPIIRSIEEHHARTGSYPEHADLGPTGLMAYPRFKYRTPSPEREDRFDGYQVSIDCPNGGINFDVFLYWPSKAYPDRMMGGWVQRIGDWAYIHE